MSAPPVELSAQSWLSVNDLAVSIAVVVAAAAVVSTAVLSVIAIRFSSGFLIFENRVKKIEGWMDRERNDQFYAMRATSEILRRVLDNSYKIDMAIAEFLKAQFRGAATTGEKVDRRMDVFIEEVGKWNDDAQRYLTYLAILREAYHEAVHTAIAAACGKYPDETTITFLEAIRPLLSQVSQNDLSIQIGRLKLLVRGVDASRWTGTDNAVVANH